jgi:hypothetical protein
MSGGGDDRAMFPHSEYWPFASEQGCSVRTSYLQDSLRESVFRMSAINIYEIIVFKCSNVLIVGSWRQLYNAGTRRILNAGVASR